MSRTFPLTAAKSQYEKLLSRQRERGDDQLSSALQAFAQFAEVDFVVPDVDDADGCLFEYGVNSLSGEPLFTVNLARQFAIVDESGEEEGYLQVACELRYAPSASLATLGTSTMWWFRHSAESFSEWWETLPIQSLIETVGDLSPIDLSVDEDMA
jgi:hypothetical protein